MTSLQVEVCELWRYPVKSLGGEQVDELRLGPRGAVGDREFALVDAVTCRVLSAKQDARLLEAWARVWDVRRFRPNLVLAAPGDAWVEDGWIGGKLQVGGAMLAVTGPCIRCVMITRPQSGLPKQDVLLRWL